MKYYHQYAYLRLLVEQRGFFIGCLYFCFDFEVEARIKSLTKGNVESRGKNVILNLFRYSK